MLRLYYCLPICFLKKLSEWPCVKSTSQVMKLYISVLHRYIYISGYKFIDTYNKPTCHYIYTDSRRNGESGAISL